MERQVILDILKFSVRAPSTHNSQPWLFKLNSNGVSVFYDEKLKLPQADSEGRDLFISIGCMLENMRIAAKYFGYDSEYNFNIIENKNICDVYFSKSTSLISDRDSKLFQQIPYRVNARGVFQNDSTKIETKEMIYSCAKEFVSENIEIKLLSDKNEITRMAEITQEAMHEAYNNSNFRKEMSNWMNSNISFKKQGLPGYSLKMPLIVSLIIPILIRYINLGKFLGNLNFKSLNSAPLVVILCGPDTKIGWIYIGMCAERLMLSIQSYNLQTSIFVGSIEISNLFEKVKNLINSNYRPQFIFAVGKIPGIHRITPRQDIYSKII